MESEERQERERDFGVKSLKKNEREGDRTVFTRRKSKQRGGWCGSLFTLQDLWRPAYAVWRGSHRLLAGGSNIISSSSAHCDVECAAKKSTSAEYKQNPLTFSPTTAVFIRVTAQKGLSLVTLEPLSPR